MPKQKEINTLSTHATRREVSSEVTWASINEPGAYVDRSSGSLYRFPEESLLAVSSPAVVKESHGASRLVKLSDDPFVTTIMARLLCARHNVEANF